MNYLRCEKEMRIDNIKIGSAGREEIKMDNTGVGSAVEKIVLKEVVRGLE